MHTESQFAQDFTKYSKSLQREVSRLASYFSVYERLNKRKADSVFEMNMAPAFFNVSMDALFLGIIIMTHKLLDEKGQEVFSIFLRLLSIILNIYR